MLVPVVLTERSSELVSLAWNLTLAETRVALSLSSMTTLCKKRTAPSPSLYSLKAKVKLSTGMSLTNTISRKLTAVTSSTGGSETVKRSLLV